VSGTAAQANGLLPPTAGGGNGITVTTANGNGSIRARTPDNVVATFDSPAADELGRAGVGGYVNDHFWSRFGAALLYSLIDYGPQLAVAALQRNNGNFGTSNYVQFVQPQQQLANTILQDQLNIPPTLEKNQGETVSIFVARDVDFSGVYDLKTSE
jgi:type IV secretion system protein VirB10